MGYCTEKGIHGYSTAIGIEWDIARKNFVTDIARRKVFTDIVHGILHGERYSRIQYGNWYMEYCTEKGIPGYSTAIGIGIEWDIARKK
eukprot:scaffold6333_cov146-Cylindrotheca_fusiformis.AAC.1